MSQPMFLVPSPASTAPHADAPSRGPGGDLLGRLLGDATGDAASPRGILLVRLALGSVFVTSGLVKFLYANTGAGRFEKLGLPSPAALAGFVGLVELVCGALLIAGLFTRLAAIPLAVDMVVALAVTKVPLLFGAGPEPVASMPKMGFWAFAYQARLDLAMLLGCVGLALVGAGALSLDARVARRSRRRDA